MANIQSPPDITDFNETEKQDLAVFIADLHQLIVSQTLADSDTIAALEVRLAALENP